MSEMSEITQFGYPVKFPKYLERFTKEDSERGIFARWASGQNFFKSCSLASAKRLMTKQGCSKELFRILDDVWNEFIEQPFAINGRKKKYQTLHRNCKVGDTLT